MTDIDLTKITPEQVKQIVGALDEEDLNGLSDDQIAYVTRIAVKRPNPKVYDLVAAALKDKNGDILLQLSSPPFQYVSPPIVLCEGVEVVFQTLYDVQNADALQTNTVFLREERPGDQLMVDQLMSLYLAHGLKVLNKQPFAGIDIGKETFELSMNSPEEALKGVAIAREKRMKMMKFMPIPIITLLKTANQAFQSIVDNVANLRITGDAEKDKARAQEVASAMGKSTGPQVAGRPQT